MFIRAWVQGGRRARAPFAARPLGSRSWCRSLLAGGFGAETRFLAPRSSALGMAVVSDELATAAFWEAEEGLMRFALQHLSPAMPPSLPRPNLSPLEMIFLSLRARDCTGSVSAWLHLLSLD